MIHASRARPRPTHAALTAPFLAAFLICSPLAAQQAPVQLFPSEPVYDEPEPAKTTAAAAPQSGLVLPEGGIQVESLNSVSVDVVGTLSANEGALGEDLWRGVSRERLSLLIDTLPTQLGSPAMRDLARRLLLTAATLPAATSTDTPLPAANATADINETATEAAPQDQDINAPGTFFRLRVERLMDMGLMEDALALMKAANTAQQHPELAATLVDANLLQSNLGEACSLVAQQRDRLEEPYWQKMLVFCQVLAEDHAGAQFGATLLADLGEEDDTFFSLIDRLTGGAQGEIESLADATPLHLALMRLAQLPLPADAAGINRAPLLRAVAESPNADLELRLKTAEQAARIGAIPAEVLAEVYLSIPFTKEELTNPLSLAEAENSARTRALLYQAAAIEAVPDTKALLLMKAFELARRAEVYPLAVRTHADQLLRLEPSLDQWWFAGEASRALFALRRPLPAQAWLGFLRIQASRDPEAQAVAERLWALERLSTGTKGAEEITLAAHETWTGRQAAAAPDEVEARRQITLAYGLMDTLGQRVPLEIWAQLGQDATPTFTRLPHLALPRLMQDAATAGRRGEAIAWALAALGEAGPAHCYPAVLGQVVAGLSQVGLEKEARALVLEAAIENGL